LKAQFDTSTHRRPPIQPVVICPVSGFERYLIAKSILASSSNARRWRSWPQAVPDHWLADGQICDQCCPLHRRPRAPPSEADSTSTEPRQLSTVTWFRLAVARSVLRRS